jgi:YbbR domain-containing protein
MKKFFIENLGLKIAAILLSIVLWFFVTSRGQSEISIDVPLELKNMPQGLELVNHGTKTVNLNIKGQERFIKNVSASNVRVSLDLSKAKRGEGTYYINREDIKLPRSITVTNINPPSVKVTTEETVSKTVRVVPVIVGEPQRGFYLKAAEILPETIVIEGVRSEIVKISALKTEPLDITGFSETVTQSLRIDINGRNIRTKIPDVRVKVEIGGRRK